jgi:CheY-like chemotaxis protein
MPTTKRVPADPFAPSPAHADRDVGNAPLVLVVDDDDLVRSGAARSLVRLGYGVESVAGGEEALALLRSGRHDVDLLFTDIRMPGAVDGFELARIVRGEFPHVAILLTTGFAGYRPRQERTRILYKPYRLAELAAAIRETLARHGASP